MCLSVRNKMTISVPVASRGIYFVRMKLTSTVVAYTEYLLHSFFNVNQECTTKYT